ncbi:MAG: hypothetical protein LUP95_03140, partial [Euryarchaeota archaeon]|nr:hypothetical protein [Euryarchaeota archaeon]
AMLRITGPLVVSGQVITSRNLANQMYAHSVASKAEVTAFISALLTELLNTIHHASIPQKVDFVRVMKQMGSEKHLQLYMPSDFLTLPFSGARGQSSGDFVDVIDYNLGAGKADQGINRMMSYHIELRSDGSSLSNLTVQYVNNNWWNYTVFTTALIPAGAELVNTSYESLKFIGPGETHSTEMTALTSQLQVTPHSTGTVTYHYTIPHAIHNDAVGLRYDLDIHKQAGIDAYTFYTSVQLPSGATLLHTSNVGMQTARGDTHVQMIYYE